MAETAKVIPLTPEFRERMERGMLRVGAILYPGRKLTIEWKTSPPPIQQKEASDGEIQH
jgi:hypothetical protein